MIELAPHTAMMVYLAFTLAAILSIWLVGHFISRNKTTISPQGELYLCEYCKSVYYDSITKPVTHCPECGNLNKKNQYKRIK